MSNYNAAETYSIDLDESLLIDLQNAVDLHHELGEYE